MGRRKKTPAIRMYFAGYLHPGEDDDLIAWWESLPKGRRFPTLVAILRSGGGMLTEIPDEDAEKADEAVELILENYLVE